MGSRQIIFISFLLPMGQHLENWEIPSVKARMIRLARGVGEGCERLLFRRFGLSKNAGRSHETLEVKERKNVRVVSLFPFLFRTSGGSSQP